MKSIRERLGRSVRCNQSSQYRGCICGYRYTALLRKSKREFVYKTCLVTKNNATVDKDIVLVM
jgi:hypothetical protein